MTLVKSTPPLSRKRGLNRPMIALATVLERLARKSPTGDVDAAAVQAALGLRSLYLAQRLLAALSASGQVIDTAEDFALAAQKLMGASVGKKLEFLFRMHDEDGDGWIRRNEIERLLHIALAENHVRLPEREVDELVAAVMTTGDEDQDGRIGLVDFIRMMVSQPAMERQLTEYGVSLLMPGKRARKMTLLPGSSWSGWVRNEVVLGFWICAYAAVNVFMFGSAVLRYRDAGASAYVQIARGAGACLNLNAALIALPMLRHTLTWVRRSVLGRLVPVDDAISLHALVGEVIFAFSLLHTGAHALNVYHLDLEPWTRANLTGVLLLAVLLVMWIFSRTFVRRTGRFELFYLTHLGYFGFVGVLLFHGPHYYVWAVVPWTWFLVERSLRSWRRGKSGRVLAAQKLPSGVTRLDLERPLGFWYAPGDYLFLRLPAVARHEWHPFTLTSAPEDPERLTVHMRSVGNWTSAVRERLPKLLNGGQEVIAQVEGPYGSASRHIMETPHAVAIAGGIGVTPFASILQSLLLRQEDPDAQKPVLQKLRFVWLNRDQYSFEWFSDLLAELEQRDTQEVLEIHTFMTAGRADMAGGVLELARHMKSRGQGGDIITGLRSQTHMGAPDFDRLLEGFYQNPGLPRPQVFFCGPAPLERVVARSCRRLGLKLRAERF